MRARICAARTVDEKVLFVCGRFLREQHTVQMSNHPHATLQASLDSLRPNCRSCGMTLREVNASETSCHREGVRREAIEWREAG